MQDTYIYARGVSRVLPFKGLFAAELLAYYLVNWFYSVRNFILVPQSLQMRLDLVAINFYLRICMVFAQELLFPCTEKLISLANSEIQLCIKVPVTGSRCLLHS